MKPLEGRVALVTGVSRRVGIGFAVASRFASMGADLFIHSFAPYDKEQPWGGDPGGAEAVLSELRRHGTRVEHMEADFLDPEAPVRTVSEAVKAFGHLDILIANHAYSTWQPFAELSAEEIDRHLAVNVRGSILLLREFARQHDGRPGGRVILMTSGQHLGPMGREVAYAASKGALHQITATLSDILIERGITVNTVNPGPTDTGYAGDEERRQVIRRMPQGRWGEPDDVARLIAWLVSDDARWVTGQVINSEGGFRRG
ncbi:MAG: SDR family oxidoreductase [Chloroflexi bacterium]|nr:SDR family oxidoreductase [Chloroflexota bacterium]